MRDDSAPGEVTAVFEIVQGSRAEAVLVEAGFAADDDIVLRRVATADGRKRAFLNDRPVSGEILRSLSEALVELHGQHDDRGLLNPRGHRSLLDDYGNLAPKVSAVRKAWRTWRQAEDELEETRAAAEEAAREGDFLAHAVAELDQLSPEPGEDDALDSKRRLMQAAEKIRDDVVRAGQAIATDGATGRIADAMRWLEGVADRADGRLDAPLQSLSRALTELGEAERGIEDTLTALSADPAELEAVEERLFALRALARKHRVQPDALSQLADELREKFALITGHEDRMTALAADAARAKAAYDDKAAVLTKARMAAAKTLDKAMDGELTPLKMERAVFTTAVEPGEAGPDGADAVTFTVATNPGMPPGPISKIASGGELSRFLLALKVCLTDGGDQTMIFDEIDRGVGGATADAVGRRLQRIAIGGQVVAVTHSPQVAARAAHHWHVVKEVTEGTALTRVLPLTETARVDEIARMLAGETISDAARQAAEVLLEG